jgi:hypothetical protein
LLSYVQNLFEAVGYVHLRGPGGSGKSQLAASLLNIGCNAGMVSGETSGVTIVRALDARGGLAIFDDLESIGKRATRRGDDGAFSTIKQVIKTGYKRVTAVRDVTDVHRDNTVTTLRYFGVKIISSTSDADELVEQRMLTIPTRRAPPGYVLPPAPADLDFQLLRDDLHAWAFEQIEALHAALKSTPAPTTRFEEITLPLRVIAQVIGYPRLTNGVREAIAAQTGQLGEGAETAESIVLQALRNLVRDGYANVQATHLAMEASSLAGVNWGKSVTNEVTPWNDPQRLGSLLKVQGWVEPGSTPRPRWLGEQRPVYRVVAEIVNDVQDTLRAAGIPIPPPRDPLEFCLAVTDCRICP